MFNLIREYYNEKTNILYIKKECNELKFGGTVYCIYDDTNSIDIATIYNKNGLSPNNKRKKNDLY